jgi:hypothetical protein
MKKTIAIAIFAALNFTATAHAGNYSQDAALMEYCQTVSMLPGEVYLGRMNGDTKQHYYDLYSSMIKDGARNADVWRFAIDYTYDKATDLKNARVMTWAYCMDNAD